MTLESVLAQLDIITEAPNGITTLRKVILELAVTGRLLRPHIAERGDSGQGTAGDWPEVPLRALGTVNPRNAVADDTVVGFCPMALIPQQHRETVAFEQRRWDEVKKSFTHFADGDLVVAKITPCFQNGKAAVMNGLPSGVGAGTTELLVLRPDSSRVLPEYLLAFVRSPSFVAGGVATMSGTAGQQRVTRKYFEEARVLLPPLHEQRRIVAKVDELMALCDEMERKQQRRVERENRLRSATAVELAHPAGSKGKPDSAQELASRLPWLVRAPQDVVHLRRAILQLAVTGKLAVHPSSELADIAVPTNGTSGETSAHDASPTGQAPTSDFLRAICPRGWKYVKAGDLLSLLTSGSRGWAKYYAPKGAVFLRIGNLDYDTTLLDLKSVQYVSPPLDAEGTRTRVQPGDVLVSITGDTGMVGLVPDGLPEAYINQHIALARPIDVANARWLAWYFASPIAKAQLQQAQRGIKNSLGLSDIAAVPVLLPPLGEQRHIIESIERLFALCDELERQLAWSRDRGEDVGRSLLLSISAS